MAHTAVIKPFWTVTKHHLSANELMENRVGKHLRLMILFSTPSVDAKAVLCCR